MDVLVALMSFNGEPSIRNVQAFKESVIADYVKNRDKFTNNYVFYEYVSDETMDHDILCEQSSEYDCLYKVTVKEHESVYRTYEKTCKFLYFINNNVQYDVLIRINTSMFLNIRLVDKVISSADEDVVYCNAINAHANLTTEYMNDIYPRGDLFIMNKKIVSGVLEYAGKYMYNDVADKNRIDVDHADDCLIGVCLIDVFGKTYFEHLKMIRYNFFPDPAIDENRVDWLSIGSRVKTLPPDVDYSGYSWDDNEYRECDAKKIIQMTDIILKYGIGYDDITINELIVPDSISRRVCFIQPIQRTVSEFAPNIFRKRG